MDVNNNARRFETYYDQTGTFIGQGAFAQVFLAKRRSTGEMVAVKISNRNCAVSQKEKEILILLSKYSHPQVVSILDIFDQGQILYIVQEYCVGGTLYDHMIQYPSVPEEQAVDIVMQVSEGLNFLHSIDIVHRDIKPENVLKQLAKDGKEYYKITDFGLSSNREKMMTTKIGTAYYVAPEILDGRAERDGYDKSVDIWALGLMFDELLHGSPFYNGVTEDEVFLKIRNESYFIRNKDYRQASFFESARFIIQQVLVNTVQRDPTKRKELSWVVDQLSQYKSIKRKTNLELNNKKTNKQLFTEEKSPIADDLLEFLSGNFPQENEAKQQQQQQQENRISPLAQSQKVQMIHQKYQNQGSLNHTNSFIRERSMWDNSPVETSDDQRLVSCRDHGLPLLYRMPFKNENQTFQIMPACSKCIQSLGVYEGDTLQKLIDECILYLLSKRFEHFYKAQEVETRTKSMIEKVRQGGELELHENKFLLQQYSMILERHENEARSLFAFRVQTLERFKAKNYTGDDTWMAECLTSSVRVHEENIFIQAIRRAMLEVGTRAVDQCRKVMEDHLIQLVENLRRKLEL